VTTQVEPHWRLRAILGLLVVTLIGAIGIRTVAARPQDDDDDGGWQIPATAGHETNPIAATDQVIAKGKDIFKSKCQKCHGPAGKGDGPDADPKHKPGNLSDSSRASRNPDGVMFYKIWNGRKNPKMPAFKSEITRDDVWTVIQYAKTLRR
jgi:mono/diheme cytochrome c family protein